MSLVLLKGAINPSLVSPDPLAGDDVGAGRTRHQILSLVSEERHVLLFHRATLVRVQQGGADGRGYRRDLRVAGHRRKSPGPQGTSRLPRHHRVDMARVAVKKRRVVHRRHSTCSWDPRRRSRRGRQRGHRCRRWRHLASREATGVGGGDTTGGDRGRGVAGEGEATLGGGGGIARTWRW